MNATQQVLMTIMMWVDQMGLDRPSPVILLRKHLDVSICCTINEIETLVVNEYHTFLDYNPDLGKKLLYYRWKLATMPDYTPRALGKSAATWSNRVSSSGI